MWCKGRRRCRQPHGYDAPFNKPWLRPEVASLHLWPHQRRVRVVVVEDHAHAPHPLRSAQLWWARSSVESGQSRAQAALPQTSAIILRGEPALPVTYVAGEYCRRVRAGQVNVRHQHHLGRRVRIGRGKALDEYRLSYRIKGMPIGFLADDAFQMHGCYEPVPWRRTRVGFVVTWKIPRKLRRNATLRNAWHPQRGRSIA